MRRYHNVGASSIRRVLMRCQRKHFINITTYETFSEEGSSSVKKIQVRYVTYRTCHIVRIVGRYYCATYLPVLAVCLRHLSLVSLLHLWELWGTQRGPPCLARRAEGSSRGCNKPTRQTAPHGRKSRKAKGLQCCALFVMNSGWSSLSVWIHFVQ